MLDKIFLISKLVCSSLYQTIALKIMLQLTNGVAWSIFCIEIKHVACDDEVMLDKLFLFQIFCVKADV